MKTQRIMLGVLIGTFATVSFAQTITRYGGDGYWQTTSLYSTGASGRQYYNPYPNFRGADGYYYSQYDPAQRYVEDNSWYRTPGANHDIEGGVYRSQGRNRGGSAYNPETGSRSMVKKDRKHYNFWY